MKKEEWRIVPSYPQVEASNLGRIRSSKNKIIKSIYVDKQGYCRIGIWIKDKTIVVRIHQLIAEAFHGFKSNKSIFVNHLDGNKSNNNIENLEICTPKRNSNHAKDIGLISIGENTYNALLKNWQVQWIHIMYLYGATFTEIREKFNLPKKYNISRVLDGKRWKHIYDLIYKNI